ncbi:unnamed protein product [Adineta steineri]|uniref:Methyltransferase domain-containing protein n=1 Tax=Adineta steineri TaxID=433720 RepID=A0A814HUQ3_9BILA|nr:unnamed protein product [Adineta steineri]CAF3659037.1 unnamed protein product [Adineta steineri]
MTENKRLAAEDLSNVWKDKNDKLTSGLKLDLVQYLLQQRQSQEWVDAKQRVIKIMKLDQFDNSQEIKILDIGCGLGIDLMLVGEEVTRLGKTVSIIGLEQNSTLIEEAKNLYENQKDHLSSNVSIQIVRGDILQMEFNDETFDIVRSDITLQHVDLPKALIEIKRVLKVNGRLIALEGGASNIFSPDEIMIRTYDTVLPNRRDGSNPTAFLQSGQFLASQDKDWIKMRGVSEMLMTKGVLTEEESKDFLKRYIEACETNQILSTAILFIIEAAKCK